jgi:iron complex outermembrane recepter protein
MKYRYSKLYATIIAVLATGHAAAQDTAPAAAQDKTQLDEIVVTATKRSTPLQRTPIAISAISAETLDKERVMTVQDITALVPGFQATTQGDHGVITMTLRGIGNDSAKTEYADPEVALFVDGVYTPRAEGAAALLLDLQAVEVLRGPQGTLWGRNSTVGAVNMQTAKPVLGESFGTLQFGMGEYDRLGARAAVNLPMNDHWALRLAFAHEQHDGYVDYQDPIGQIPSLADQQAAYIAGGGTLATFQAINPNLFTTGGDKYNAQNQSAIRVSSLWQPSDALSWNLSLEYFRDRGTPSANLMQTPRAGQPFWSALIDTAPFLERDSLSLRSRVDYDINDALTLSYVAGISDFNGSSDYDQDGGVLVPTSFATGATYQQDRTNYSNYFSHSHELNLKSAGEHTVDWILGLYYAAEDNEIRFDIPIFNGTQQGTVGWQGSFIQPKETVQSSAAFGQATWNINDDFRLTGGLRYTHDHKENEGGRGWGWQYNPAVPQVPISPGTTPSAGTGFGFGIAGVNDGNYSHNQTTWLLRADGDITEKFLIYGSVSTGYKSGGLQDGGVPYKHESLTNYEIGTKNSFRDGRITWNNALYYQDFKDFQLAAPISFVDGSRGLGFSNVEGSTKVMGFESELNARLTDNDRVQIAMSILTKKKLGTLLYAGSNDYQGLPACPPASGIGNCLDVSGNELAHAPDAQFNVIYEHDFDLGNGGRLTPRISAHYETESWLSPFNLGDGDKQDSYGRGDFNLRYEAPQSKWWMDLYVDNISDGKVRTNAGRTSIAGGQFIYTSQYLPPRTIGVNFGYGF